MSDGGDCLECGRCACCIARSQAVHGAMAGGGEHPPEYLPAMAHSVIRRRAGRPQDWREVELARAALRVPTWSMDAPTAPGWYWLRSPGGSVRVRQVLVDDSGAALEDGAGNLWPLPGVYAGYSFAGPIPEPADTEGDK